MIISDSVIISGHRSIVCVYVCVLLLNSIDGQLLTVLPLWNPLNSFEVLESASQDLLTFFSSVWWSTTYLKVESCQLLNTLHYTLMQYSLIHQMAKSMRTHELHHNCFVEHLISKPGSKSELLQSLNMLWFHLSYVVLTGLIIIIVLNHLSKS